MLVAVHESAFGTKRTSDDVRFLVANGGKADIPGKVISVKHVLRLVSGVETAHVDDC
jgi:hypothetical protein